MNNKDKLYNYRAYVKNVYDGDTITVDISLGFHVTMTDIKVRLIGIDTPEIRTKDLNEKKEGYKAKNRLLELVENKEIYIKVLKKGKFGRWVSKIYLTENDCLEDNTINQQLIDEGLAKPFMID